MAVKSRKLVQLNIAPEMDRRCRFYALVRGISRSQVLEEALSAYLNSPKVKQAMSEYQIGKGNVSKP
jgi:hypothetical protein